jgi:folate-dependent phosphoribosylglycinamide formyltransferase PurN
LEIVGIFSDSKQSRAAELAERFNILCVTKETEPFKSRDERKEYFDSVTEQFENLSINLLIYAGFMKITTPSFAENFPGINSHPADLLVLDGSGKPRYVGMPVIEMAIKDGQESIRASCCAVVNPVDSGMVISQSVPITVSKEDLNDIKGVHERLKLKEWEYYPKTIEMLCSGEISLSKLPYLFNE